MTSLLPVSGTPSELYPRLRTWLEDPSGALAVQTSGSSGRPKQVLLSAAALRFSAEATHHRLGGPGQWLLALPAHYVAGLTVLVRSVLAGTPPVLLDEHPDFTGATDALLSQGRHYTAIVPTQLHRLLADGQVSALRRFDAVLLGGAAADPRLVDRARAEGVRLVTTYGMSETCGGCVYDGVPLDGVAVALATTGRIRIRGPVLFDGYRDDPALTAASKADGWLLTPDRGRFDQDGRLEVLGRLDDVVVSGGVNVSLTEVERRVRACPGVADAAVVAVDDEEWGSRVVACVVAPADEPAAVTLEKLRDWVAAELPRSWAPRQLVVVDRLPLLGNGKLDRRRMAELAAPAGHR